MLNFFKSTAGIITIIVVVLAVILIIMNWSAIVAWWNDETPVTDVPVPSTEEVIRDNNGNTIGRYANALILGNLRARRACQKVTNPQGITGWIGDCTYPIS